MEDATYLIDMVRIRGRQLLSDQIQPQDGGTFESVPSVNSGYITPQHTRLHNFGPKVPGRLIVHSPGWSMSSNRLQLIRYKSALAAIWGCGWTTPVSDLIYSRAVLYTKMGLLQIERRKKSTGNGLYAPADSVSFLNLSRQFIWNPHWIHSHA